MSVKYPKIKFDNKQRAFIVFYQITKGIVYLMEVNSI